MHDDVVVRDLMRVSDMLNLDPANFRANRGMCARIYGEAKSWAEANWPMATENQIWDRVSDVTRCMTSPLS